MHTLYKRVYYLQKIRYLPNIDSQTLIFETQSKHFLLGKAGEPIKERNINLRIMILYDLEVNWAQDG